MADLTIIERDIIRGCLALKGESHKGFVRRGTETLASFELSGQEVDDIAFHIKEGWGVDLCLSDNERLCDIAAAIHASLERRAA